MKSRSRTAKLYSNPMRQAFCLYSLQLSPPMKQYFFKPNICLFFSNILCPSLSLVLSFSTFHSSFSLSHFLCPNSCLEVPSTFLKSPTVSSSALLQCSYSQLISKHNKSMQNLTFQIIHLIFKWH